jgi:hypothetical protein
VAHLKGKVLALQHYALPEDIALGGMLARRAYSAAPKGLAKLIRVATATNFGTSEQPKTVLELTAVAPNVRNASPAKGIAPRFWYMLPEFAARHRPDVFMPRVLHGHPRSFLNRGRGALVDANFSTLWLDANSDLNAHGLLAILNSAWCKVMLELSAAVLGGGALKVEATHLRRLLVPALDQSDRQMLNMLGKKLETSSQSGHLECLELIDRQVCKCLLGKRFTLRALAELHDILSKSMLRRRSHAKR